MEENARGYEQKKQPPRELVSSREINEEERANGPKKVIILKASHGPSWLLLIIISPVQICTMKLIGMYFYVFILKYIYLILK